MFQLCQNIFNQMAMDIGETVIAATETIGQRFEVQTQQMENSGVKIVDGLLVLDNAIAVLIRSTMNITLFETTTSQP